jgi:hypothetical protein
MAAYKGVKKLQPTPSPVGLDPFDSLGRRIRQWQVENRNGLPGFAIGTDGDNLTAIVEIDFDDSDVLLKHLRVKWDSEIIADHCQKAAPLLGLIIGIDRRQLD